MDNLFKIRTLTKSINALRSPGRRIVQRHFLPKLNWVPGDRIAWDIISGSEEVLATIKVHDPATVGNKTGRKTITMEAPRLSEKRLVHTYEINAMRAYGEQASVEMMRTRIAREQLDMRNKFDRTLEFWAAYSLRGAVKDADLATNLVDYTMQASHIITLAGTDKWNDPANSTPILDLREWKRLVEDDSGHEITGWTAWCGFEVMDALVNHTKLGNYLFYDRGRQIAEQGRIATLADVTFIEYNGSFKDSTGARKRFIDSKDLILVGDGDDVFDFPFNSVVDEEAPGGVGQPGNPELYFSKSWIEKDPSGRWIKGETRCMPVLKRPDALVRVTAIA